MSPRKNIFKEWGIRDSVFGMIVRKAHELHSSKYIDEDEISEVVDDFIIQLKNKHIPVSAGYNYFEKVIERQTIDFIRRKTTQKRGGELYKVPLNGSIGTEDEEESDLTIENEASYNDYIRFGQKYTNTQNANCADLKKLLQKVFEDLNPLQKQICGLLSLPTTDTQIALEAGISRPTLIKEKKLIRRVFRRYGLNEFI